MKTYDQMLDGAYEHFHITNLRQVWGIAIGVLIGWLVTLPSETRKALAR